MDSAFLRSEIESDISRREGNMARVKTLSSRYSFLSNDVDTWLRCSFPIIYAEWEGFFVNAMTLFIREVNAIGLSLDELAEEYYINNLEKRYKQFKQYPLDDKIKQKKKFLYDLKGYLRQTTPITISSEINTESNLGFNTLNTILNLYNIEKIQDHLDHDATSYKEKLDAFLLDKRNGIAHGDPSVTITANDVSNAIQLVSKLMYEVKERICNGFEQDVFKV